MKLISLAIFSLIGVLPYLESFANAAGVLEMGIVFPRPNETYAPTDYFPIVFALRNAELARNLRLDFTSFVRNRNQKANDVGSSIGIYIGDFTNANFTGEVYFDTHHLTELNITGSYEVVSTVSWLSCNEVPGRCNVPQYEWPNCDENGNPLEFMPNSTNFVVPFDIKEGGKVIDLVAATANGQTCPAQGKALRVTDMTREIPEPPFYLADRGFGTCAVLDSASPTPTADPCSINIDSAAAASMSADLHSALCRGLNPPSDCPKKNAASPKLAVAGIMSFAATLGAIGFILA